ncbi:MAG: hypothetical protein GY830_01680 [Bacteroidetes bacterium]|nr:hypothetical protein [Bacteroidota bacterium]
MLLEHANEKYLDYKLEKNHLNARDRKKLIRDRDNGLDNQFLLNDELSEMPLYKLNIPGTEEDSFILLANDSSYGNIIKVPDSVFKILELCNGISFEYQPCMHISEEAKSKFKILIDRTISIIELIYHIMTKYHNTSNFDIYLSLVSSMLDIHCKLLNSYIKIMKVKERLGKNLNYIIVSTNNVAFGMIDPEGCLLLENNEFNYKHLAFKPVITTKSDLKFTDHLNKNIENTAKDSNNSNNKSTKKIISSDIISNWFSKIMDKHQHFFVIKNQYFVGEKGLKKILENKECKLTKISKI